MVKVFRLLTYIEYYLDLLSMVKKEVEVQNSIGIHVRPAHLIVKEAMKYKSKLRLSKDDKEVDGKSMMEILMLEAAKGSKITIIADGVDEQELVNAIEKLFNERFGED